MHIPGHHLPDVAEMYRAFLERDSRYDGIFLTGVITTGIFCRPSCPARKPARENVRFFATAADAQAGGFRACLRCRPLEPPGQPPEAIERLIEELDENPALRLRDRDLRSRGLDPATVRRWFKRHHGATFHAWQRARRLGGAIAKLGRGGEITGAAFGSGYDSLSGFTEALRKLTGRPPSASRDAVVVHVARILTPLGPMVAGMLGDAVCLLEFTDRRMLPTQLRTLEDRLACVFVPGDTPASRKLALELEAWFAGDPRGFSTPIHMAGTPFQEAAWAELLRIPRGTTRSYAEQAAALGRPTAVRAVARANGANRIAIVVPCHRVVGSDGRLRGYGGGLARKRALLALEGWEAPQVKRSGEIR
jgi:AraC family transcriptional regulator, regulatory protein of adaptative response / methylated-DNA-[protein]-cysteine methyltransferase